MTDLAHAWRPMNNSFGAAWDLSDLYPPPFDLRLRDSVGRMVIAECELTCFCKDACLVALHDIPA